MKIQKLIVKNIGMIADATIELNKPMIVLFGEVRQGKTTFLNAVKWGFGGKFPADILRNGETEASITQVLDEGMIQRTFYRAKDGSTKARPLHCERRGVTVEDPVAEIKKFLNPFLLDQNFLANKSELERKQWFASQFAVDTAGLDSEIIRAEAKAQETRAKLKGYGDIDTTAVEPPPSIAALQEARAGILKEHSSDLEVLRGELAKCRADYGVVCAAILKGNQVVRENNFQRAQAMDKRDGFKTDVVRLERQLAEAKDGQESYEKWLIGHPPMDAVLLPPEPDTSVLEKGLSSQPNTAAVDQAISQCEAQAVRFEQYQANLKRQAARDIDECLIRSLESQIRELRGKKIAKLKECSVNSGIPGLAFDEAGNFSYDGCQAGMLSTSQLMELSSRLSALYPEGFGLELLDRGESLGKSIFQFVERAKQENKTILATVVGERPAEAPAEVGVFVVEQGTIK
jgi:DNA repair exonuclease SbcCD ATPase subunit